MLRQVTSTLALALALAGGAFAKEPPKPADAFAHAVTGFWQHVAEDLNADIEPEALVRAVRDCGAPRRIGTILAKAEAIRASALVDLPGAVAFLPRKGRLVRIDLIRMKGVVIGAVPTPVARGGGQAWTVRTGGGRMRVFTTSRKLGGRKANLMFDATGLYLKCPSAAPAKPKSRPAG